MADAGTTEAPPTQPEAPKRGGYRGGKKRKSTEKDEDKKGRKARVSRVPAAPPSIDITTSHKALGDCNVTRIAALIGSDDPDHASRALNALLKASADTDANYCLGVGGERVIDALCRLFDETVGWDDDSNSQEETIDFKTLEPSVMHWGAESLSGKHKRWREWCRSKFASPLAPSCDPTWLIDHENDVPILDTVLVIFRNLSYVAQNLRFLLYSDNALRILTGALYYRGFSFSQKGGDNHSISHNSNMCVYAIETLTNMAPLFDITGRQLFIDRVFLESDEKEITSTVPYQTSGAAGNKESSIYGIASRLGFGGMHLAKQYDTRAETVDSISDDVVWSTVSSHVKATLAIFPALSTVLDPNDTMTVTTSSAGWHRPSLQAMLELLVALIENTDNRGIFLNVPDLMLHQLTEMLYLHRLGPESLDYIDPVNHPVVRVLPVKLSMGYDVTVDTDIRDRACELLVKLTELSPSARRRVGMATSISGMRRREGIKPTSGDGLSPSILQSGTSSSPIRINVRLFDSITSMISTSSGRGDAASLASQLLSNMATVPENKVGILYCERKLIATSSMNADVANVACNGIFNRM